MESWEIARGMTPQQLYDFKGQVIPWPPADTDIIWWGELIYKLHQMKQGTPNNRILAEGLKRDPLVYGKFGECKLALTAKLPYQLTVWPEAFWWDIKLPDGTTVDVKTSTQLERHKVMLNLPLYEIERSAKLNHGVPKFADLFVLAWLPRNLESLTHVKLMGWCGQEALVSAPIERWSRFNPKFSDAHALRPTSLYAMDSLYNRIRPPQRTPTQRPLFSP
jgi:hypothetical protein